MRKDFKKKLFVENFKVFTIAIRLHKVTHRGDKS